MCHVGNVCLQRTFDHVATLLHHSGTMCTVELLTQFLDLRPNSSGQCSGTEQLMLTAQTQLVFKCREESLCTCVAALKSFSVLNVRIQRSSKRLFWGFFLLTIDWKMSVYQFRKALFRPGMNGDNHHRYRFLKNLTICALTMMKNCL